MTPPRIKFELVLYQLALLVVEPTRRTRAGELVLVLKR